MNISAGHTAAPAKGKARSGATKPERTHCPPEMTWLWARNPADDAACGRMKDALAEAIMLMPTEDVERIADLAEAGEPGAALRLTARLARTHRMLGAQRQRDLAACALLVAVVEHSDERAAIEFAVLTALRAGQTLAQLRDEFSYPPPLDQPARLRARMWSRGRLAIRLVASCGGWARAVSSLGKMADGDPLAGYGSSGRPRSGWYD